MRVLILTNNILTERDIQFKLQILGHEVYVSNLLLNKYLTKSIDETINPFDLCIISKTVNNLEAKILAAELSRFNTKIFREVENIYFPKSGEKVDLYGYVSNEQSITELREAIA